MSTARKKRLPFLAAVVALGILWSHPSTFAQASRAPSNVLPTGGGQGLIDPSDSGMLLLDHQSGLFQTVKDIGIVELRNNTIMLAKLAKLYAPVAPTYAAAGGRQTTAIGGAVACLGRNTCMVWLTAGTQRCRAPSTRAAAQSLRPQSAAPKRTQDMSTVTTKDGVEIYYKDWGTGPVVTFSHGWPLNADAWDGQMLFLVQNGYRCVAHDRRGHGRSSQASAHNDMDGYADDLAAVIAALDLRDATLVGHSTGGGEVARYIGRHGSKRVRKAVLVAAVPPIMLKSPANPEGLPMEVFDQIRAGVAGDRSQYYKDLAIAFYGANRPGAKVSQGTLDQFWLWSMQAGTKNAYESVKAFSETDFTQDLKKFDVPTLVLHGEDDQIVPVKDSAKKSARLIKGAKEIYYPGAPHGLTATHQERVNADLLAFIKG
jgi:non-heme chloroperoxidase